MSRYRGPVSRLCRREGMKLYLKGAKCYTKKCPFERRPTPPGQHGVRRRKVSEFGIQLREKQKMRRIYSRPRAPVQALLRDGRAPSRRDRREPAAPARDAPRQRRLPDGLRHQPRPGAPARRPRPLRHQRPRHDDPVAPGRRGRHGSRSARRAASRNISRTHARRCKRRAAPGLAERRRRRLAGSVTALPRRDQMPLELNEQLVVEFYSR